MAVTSAASTRANLPAIFKDLFPQRRLEQLAIIEHPFLTWVPKADDLDGNGLWIPYRIGTPQGRSRDFAAAQASVSSGTAARAFIEAKDYYGVVSLDSKSMRQARSNMGSFVRLKETEIEDIVKQMGQDLATHIW